jgi:hypothetical protein
MDSYDWTRGFAVAWISRKDILCHLRVTEEEVFGLTDHDMKEIASMMEDIYRTNGYWDDLALCTKRLLEDKEVHRGFSSLE